MFWQNVKGVLTKPKKVAMLKEYKIVDPGLIAICIVFLQNLISVEKPNGYQIFSLIAFLIAIPMLAIHFFAIQTISEPTLYLPAYLAKSFEYLYEIGVAGTGFGIIFVLGQFFWAIPFAFIISIVVAMTVFFFVRINIDETNKEKRKNLNN